jgi:hypothetical protein
MKATTAMKAIPGVKMLVLTMFTGEVSHYKRGGSLSDSTDVGDNSDEGDTGREDVGSHYIHKRSKSFQAW